MLSDLLNALRQWLRTPVVTAVALASLGLGIGANVALFGVVDALLLKTLPVRDPQTLIRVVTQDPDHGDVDLELSSRAWEYVLNHQPFAESVLAAGNGRVNLARGGEARFVQAVYINGGGIATLGVEPTLGRGLRADDDSDGAQPAAMISHALWQRDYQGTPDAVGQTIWINNQPFTIVGVMPRAFSGFDVVQRADVFVPLSGAPLIRRGVGNTPLGPHQAWLALYGRMKPGQSLAATTTAIRAWIPELRDSTAPPGPDAANYLIHPASAVPGGQGVSFLREQYRQPMLVLFGAVGLVLVIACANLAALVLARFADRRHELGVRLALGAARGRILRMLVVESVLLASVGGVVGVAGALVFADTMTPFLTSSIGTQSPVAIALDARLLAFAALMALLSGLMSGLWPAWRASRLAPQLSIQASSRNGMQGAQSTRTLRLLVAAQISLSLVLVAGASVMVRSFVGLVTAPTGVDADQVLIAQVTGTLSGVDPSSRYERIEAIRRALRLVPGATMVSGGMITPLSNSMAAAQVEVPGSIYKTGENDVRMNGRSFTPFNSVLPHYFATIGTPILAGRDFDERDGPGTPSVAIVNQAFARRHFGSANPIGRTMIVNGKTLEIVGLAADAKLISLKDLAPVALGYGAFTQRGTTAPISTLRFALRAEDTSAIRPTVAAAIRGIDPRLAVEFRDMRDEASATVNRERLLAWLAGVFASLGLAMAVIGLYGTFTYAVTRRRAEIGVRMALGAERSDILGMILREVAIILTIGTMAGLAGAFASGRMLQGLLFSTSAHDPGMLALALTSVIGAAVLASLFPARRASRVDPMVALREE